MTRRLVRGLMTASAAAAIVTTAAVALRPEPDGPTGRPASRQPMPAEISATAGGRPLAGVSNAEMEEVIAANPDVVPMRLALVERYLRGGELEQARNHAEQAVNRASAPADQARALRYLGWTTAHLADPGTGEQLLEQSLALEPGNLNGLWYLARVRFELLDRPGDAAPLLEEILSSDSPDSDQRRLVQSLLDEVHASI